MIRRLSSVIFLTLIVFALAAPRQAVAQLVHRGEVHRNAEGDVFDFHPDGAWRKLARNVSIYRQRLLARGDFAGLNAPVAAGSPLPAPAAVTGVRRVPAILFGFADSTRGFANDTSRYRRLLFETTPPTSGEIGYTAPYSMRGYYSQLSHGLLDLQGVVTGWYQLASNEDAYTGGNNCSSQNPYPPSTQCNGIWSSNAVTAMRSALTQALGLADVNVNFALYDNDGPDGFANSNDDDGYVDMTIFVHSEIDGACYAVSNGHLWSHRSQLSYTTNDARSVGGNVRIRDYTLQSGVGGASSCTGSQILSIGTAAHETGHAFGLPDLYDTQNQSEGVGNWGLMGSGNQSSSPSPSRMEAWSLNELGWVTVVPLTRDTTVTFGAATASDTAYMIRVPSSLSTRGEYFLIENRQFGESDTALIRIMCGRSGMVYPTCRGGLGIWHIDSAKVFSGRGTNSVNAPSTVNGVPIRGVSLVQADNRRDLEQAPGSVGLRGRGDAGDLWPGYGTGTPKTRFSFNTSPANKTNADTTRFAGFEIDSIRLVTPGTDGPMTFKLRFGRPTVVRAADTLARVKVEGGSLPAGGTYNRFASLLDSGVTYTISMDDQTTPDGRTQFVWQSWSNGQPRTHTISGSFNPADSIVANVLIRYKLQATATGTGTIASSPTVDHANGAFVDRNTSVTLTATAGSGFVFERWTGDTNTATNPLAVPMNKPYAVVAAFSSVLAISSAAPAQATMGKPYSSSLTASGGTGQFSWIHVTGPLPPGVTLVASGGLTGTPTAAGTYTFTVRVTSGVQTLDQQVSVTVVEPTLTVANVVGGLLGTGGTVTADDARYLDLVGNNNGNFDLGDFLAWVNRTNAQPLSVILPRTDDPETVPSQDVEEGSP